MSTGSEWLREHKYLFLCNLCSRGRWYQKSFARYPFDHCPCVQRVSWWVLTTVDQLLVDMANGHVFEAEGENYGEKLRVD